MIGGILIQRKAYGMIDYLASGLLCIGLIVFTLADVELQTEYNYTGKYPILSNQTAPVFSIHARK